MKRLGYTRYVARVVTRAAAISSEMARQAPAGLIGIHLNMPASAPPEIDGAHGRWRSDASRTGCRRDALHSRGSEIFSAKGAGYRHHMGTRPQTLGYGIADSPRRPRGLSCLTTTTGRRDSPITRLNQATTFSTTSRSHWLTNTGVSPRPIYWEIDSKGNTEPSVRKTGEISLPVAVTVPGEIYRAPRSRTQRAYRSFVYYNELDKGGHFAAWEQPALFCRRNPRGVSIAARITLKGRKEFS